MVNKLISIDIRTPIRCSVFSQKRFSSIDKIVKLHTTPDKNDGIIKLSRRSLNIFAYFTKINKSQI